MAFLVSPLWAGDRFVAPSASGCTFPASNYNPATNSCPGGSSRVVQTLQACHNEAVANDVCQIRAGTYQLTLTGSNQSLLSITTSGTSGNPITYQAYNNETVILECFDAGTPLNFCYNDANDGGGQATGPTQTNARLINLQANWIVIKDLELRGSSRWGIDVVGNNNVIENVLTHSHWEFGVEIEGNSNTLRDVEVRFNRHQSGVVISPSSNDNTIEYLYTWRNGYEEMCHTGTGQPCKVLPYPGDPDGGGNSDGLACRNTCEANPNICLRNIIKDSVAYGNGDDGMDLNCGNSLVLRTIAFDNGPEGNMGFKVQFAANSSNQYVKNVLYFNDSRGADLRANVGGQVFQHNTVLGSASHGIMPNAGEANYTFQSNVSANNGGSDFNLNCANAAACTTNWSADGSGGTALGPGAPQLTNPTLFQSGGNIVFTIPPSENTIRKRLMWLQNQFAVAFVPAAGSGLINAGTGTSVQWTNPQTTATESAPCDGVCDVGAYEVGEPMTTLRTYPAAQGYGATTQGPRAGSGYVVRHVTTLNYSGPGSIQAALETDPGGAGVFVVFEVAGYINVPGPAAALMNLQAAYPNFYIAGHTAPGGGVCLRLDPSATEETVLLAIQASQMIVRGLCFRHGVDPGGVNSAPNIAVSPGVSNVLVDRITSDFSVAEHFDASANVNGDVSNVTVQRSAFINSLEPNSNGVLINDDEAQPQTIIGLSFLRNFIAHSRARNPRVTSRNSAGVELINTAIYGTEESGGSVLNSQTDIVGTYVRESAGLPNFDWENDPGYGGRPWYNDKSGAAGDPSTYMTGNIVEYRSGTTAEDTTVPFAVVRDLATVGQAIPAGWQRGTRLATPAAFPATITDAATAWDTIVVQQNVGAVWRLTETGTLVRRPIDTGLEKALIDARDKRPQTTLGRTTYISDPADVGGFPTIATGTPYADVDRDGQADVWETANGLNPADPADAFLTTLQPPYLNIEVFLFGIEVNGTDGATLRYGARISNGAILR